MSENTQRHYRKQEQEEKDYCEFCHILSDYRKNPASRKEVINVNHEFFAFHDFNKAAFQHILVCPQQHIETALHFRDPLVVERMLSFGKECLESLINQQNNKKESRYKMFGLIESESKKKFLSLQNLQYKFGFHLKPHISVFHVHLHCFVLPFHSQFQEKIHFGWMLKDPQQIVKMIQHQNSEEKSKL